MISIWNIWLFFQCCCKSLISLLLFTEIYIPRIVSGDSTMLHSISSHCKWLHYQEEGILLVHSLKLWLFAFFFEYGNASVEVTSLLLVVLRYIVNTVSPFAENESIWKLNKWFHVKAPILTNSTLIQSNCYTVLGQQYCSDISWGIYFGGDCA